MVSVAILINIWGNIAVSVSHSCKACSGINIRIIIVEAMEFGIGIFGRFRAIECLDCGGVYVLGRYTGGDYPGCK